MTRPPDEVVALLLGFEEELWHPASRYDRARVDALFADDFYEIGRSGRVHQRDALLASPPGHFSTVIPFPNFAARVLAPDVVQLTYDSIVTYDDGVLRARRSSIWTLTPSGWRIRFHQGTPFED